MKIHTTGKEILLGAQMLFVAFGALVLVPLLTGLDPSIALFTAGIGTIIFQLITNFKVPIFLASSFAFIAPIQVGIQQYGVAETLGGLASAALLYLLLSLLVKYEGVKVIEKYLPPVVTGPVIMVIGLKLAPAAVGMTKNFTGGTEIDYSAILVAVFSLAVTIFVVLKGKGIFSLIPIICGVVAGYILTIFLGSVNFQPVADASWFSIPWISAIANGSCPSRQYRHLRHRSRNRHCRQRSRTRLPVERGFSRIIGSGW